MTLDDVLAALVPWPEDGSHADGPVAVDATDRLLLDEARDLLGRTPDVVVIGDRFGALTLGAIALGAERVRVHTDAVTAERALAVNAERCGLTDRVEVHATLDAGLLTGARLVLLQLPTSLAELSEIAELVSRAAADDVVVLGGGRVKHMTRSMNDVLAAELIDVRATLARQKSRVLVASGVRPDRRDAPRSSPAHRRLTEAELVAAAGVPGVEVVARGGVFAGDRLDLGTRFLLQHADRWPRAAAVRDAVDLGSGSGLLAATLALRYPEAAVVATDRSAAATASTTATAEANGVGERVTVVRDDAGDSLPDASADLVLCNPPFHDRASVRSDAAHRMFATAGRVLRPGGELWTVFNTPARYRNALTRAVGPTELVGQNPKFTVTRSRRP